MIKPLAIMLVALLATPAHAALSRKTLDGVALEPPRDAVIPMDVRLSDRAGVDVSLRDVVRDRATLLVPVDYVCRATCGPAASIISAALVKTRLQPGKDYNLVFVGLRPAESVADRDAFIDAHLGTDALKHAARALTGDASAIAALMSSIGYRYVVDDATDSIAHPTGAVTLTADGRVARVLSTLALDPNDLSLALVEASHGAIGGLAGQLRLLCFGFDAAHGIYTARITSLLQISGVLTLLLLGLSLLVLRLRSASTGSRT